MFSTKRSSALSKRVWMRASIVALWVLATLLFLLARRSGSKAENSDSNLSLRIQQLPIQSATPTQSLTSICQGGVLKVIQSVLKFTDETAKIMDESSQVTSQLISRVLRDRNIRSVFASPLVVSIISGLYKDFETVALVSHAKSNIASIYCQSASILSNVLSPRLMCTAEDMITALTVCFDTSPATSYAFYELHMKMAEQNCSNSTPPSLADYLQIWFAKHRRGLVMGNGKNEDSKLISPRQRWQLMVILKAIFKMQQSGYVKRHGGTDFLNTLHEPVQLIPGWTTYRLWQLNHDFQVSSDTSSSLPFAALLVPHDFPPTETHEETKSAPDNSNSNMSEAAALNTATTTHLPVPEDVTSHTRESVLCQAIVLLRGTSGTVEWNFNLDTALVHIGPDGAKAHQGLVNIVNALWAPLLSSLTEIGRSSRCQVAPGANHETKVNESKISRNSSGAFDEDAAQKQRRQQTSLVTLSHSSNLRVMVAGYSLGGGVAHVLGERLAGHLRHGVERHGRRTNTTNAATITTATIPYRRIWDPYWRAKADLAETGVAAAAETTTRPPSPLVDEETNVRWEETATGPARVSVVTLGAPNVFNAAARKQALEHLDSVLSVAADLDPVPRLPCSSELYAPGLFGCRSSKLFPSFAFHSSHDDHYVSNPGLLEFGVHKSLTELATRDRAFSFGFGDAAFAVPLALQVGMWHVCSYACFVSQNCGDETLLCSSCPLLMSKSTDK